MNEIILEYFNRLAKSLPTHLTDLEKIHAESNAAIERAHVPPITAEARERPGFYVPYQELGKKIVEASVIEAIPDMPDFISNMLPDNSEERLSNILAILLLQTKALDRTKPTLISYWKDPDLPDHVYITYQELSPEEHAHVR